MTLQRTALFHIHKQSSARMVPFAGWEMPVQYTSIIEEHMKVRSECGLFDVSHMGEIRVSGPQSKNFLERLTPNLLEGQKDGQIRYNAILNDRGGIRDDVTIFRESESSYFLIVNASNVSKIWSYLNERKEPGITLENLSDRYSLLALQGPLAEEILKLHKEIPADRIEALPYYHYFDTDTLRISRTGYTGEDGFEIMCENERAASLWKELIELGGTKILPAGLGARDSLRLEAMYPLYGHELTEDRTPVESGIGWIVKEKAVPYPKMDYIVQQKLTHPDQKICGFILEEGGIAREGMDVLIEGRTAGTVQSGVYSPVLKKGIGTAFLPYKEIAAGRQVEIRIRDRLVKAKLHTGPFVKGTAGKKRAN
jgi:aminomethyltransferase